MKSALIRKKRTVAYKDLRIGDIFVSHEAIYMIIDHERDAVCLCNVYSLGQPGKIIALGAESR